MRPIDIIMSGGRFNCWTALNLPELVIKVLCLAKESDDLVRKDLGEGGFKSPIK
jgi:hypothetical protein